MAGGRGCARRPVVVESELSGGGVDERGDVPVPRLRRVMPLAGVRRAMSSPPFRPTAPSAPRSLTAAVAPTVGVGSASVRLSWAAPVSTGGSPLISYLVQRSSDGGRTWVCSTGSLSLSRSYLAGGLTNGVTYRFRVSARNAVGWSSPSNVVAAVPQAVSAARTAVIETSATDSTTTTAPATTTVASTTSTTSRVDHVDRHHVDHHVRPAARRRPWRPQPRLRRRRSQRKRPWRRSRCPRFRR